MNHRNKHMNKPCIYCVPEGGLGNRMRVIASAYNLHKNTGVDVRIIWLRDKGLNAKFIDIFKPITHDGFVVEDLPSIFQLIYDRPRKKNLYIPKILHTIRFGNTLYDHDFKDNRYEFNFNEWVKQNNKNKIIHCCTNFGVFDSEVYQKLFLPSKEVAMQIQGNLSQLADDAIGIHIRRTDNAKSIEQSPLSLFISVIEKELSLLPPPELKNSKKHIFLATDDQQTKNELLKRFGYTILTPSYKACRSNEEGIIHALCEMYTLAHCKKIYGSFYSSFSEMASYLGKTSLVVLNKDKSNII